MPIFCQQKNTALFIVLLTDSVDVGESGVVQVLPEDAGAAGHVQDAQVAPALLGHQGLQALAQATGIAHLQAAHVVVVLYDNMREREKDVVVVVVRRQMDLFYEGGTRGGRLGRTPIV